MKTNLRKIMAAVLAISALFGASGCNIVVDEDPADNNSTSYQSENSSSSDNGSSLPDNFSEGDNSSSEESSSETQSSSQEQDSSTDKDTVDPGEMSGSIWIENNRGIVLFGGGRAGAQDFAETVNAIRAKLGDGINVYSMVAPTAGSFYLSNKNKMANEWDYIEYINGFFVGVTPVDAYTALSKHTDEDIYFRTDHHWTQLGAYYAAEEFAKVAGVPFAALSTYEKYEHSGYIGSLYGYSGENAKLRKNPDTFTFYKPTNNYTVSVYSPDYKYKYEMPLTFNDSSNYMIYGSDIQINYVKTDCKNGRKLVIVGDSYDNALFLNLTNSFEEIWVCDMRAVTSDYVYFDLNIVDFIQKMGATDVLFNMDTFSAVGSNRLGLKTMLNSTKTLS